MNVNITVKELSEKLNSLLKSDLGVDLGARIVSAMVVLERDNYIDYPPGTILFECESMDKDEPTHILSINPTRIGPLQ